MEIIYLDEVDSTQKFLIQKIKDGMLEEVTVVAKRQKKGIGSRGNSWTGEDGNLFFSFSKFLKNLPNDLPLQSSSIYFSYILKMALLELGSQVWLKWPNDFYLNDKKVGGTITNKIDNILICGIGINSRSKPQNFGKLDIDVDNFEILDRYFYLLNQNFSWKEIFSKYRIEFYKSKSFSFHIKNEKISLKDAKLCFDGSVKINDKRIYSSR